MSNGEFHVWHGNVGIVPVVTAPAVATDERNFDTCQHRSPTEITRMQATCCGTRKLTGFQCSALGIFGLKPENCVNCKSYSKKT